MMKIDVCHSLTGELLDIELPEGALVEELRNVLKVRAHPHTGVSLAIFFLMQHPNSISEQKQTGVELESQVPCAASKFQRPSALTLYRAQVLICEWGPETNLVKGKPLKHFGLPAEGHTIFFYDSSWFSAVRPPPPTHFNCGARSS